LKIGCYALAITPFGTAAINAGLAKELTPPSSQTGAAVIPGHIGDQGGDAARAANGGAGETGAAAQSDAGIKGNAGVKGDKSVGITGNSGGIKGEPHAGPHPDGGAVARGSRPSFLLEHQAASIAASVRVAALNLIRPLPIGKSTLDHCTRC